MWSRATAASRPTSVGNVSKEKNISCGSRDLYIYLYTHTYIDRQRYIDIYTYTYIEMCVYIYLYITIKPINIIRFSEKATFHVTNRR